MKYFYFLFFILISCKYNDEFSIRGKVDAKQINKVYLESINEKTLDFLIEDSSDVKDGFFEFKGKYFEPELKYLRFNNIRERLSVFTEDDDVFLDINSQSILKSKVITGKENVVHFDYNLKSLQVREQNLEFRSRNKDLMTQARKIKDIKVVDSLLYLNSKILNGYYTNMEEQLKDNPNSYMSLILINGLFEYPNIKKKDILKHYNSLNDYYKNLKIGKEIKIKLDTLSR